MPEDSPNTPPQTMPAIRRSMMPRDTNAMGSIFGGVILAEVDLAAGIEARLHCDNIFVTVAFDDVEFKEPVRVGDLVSFHTSTEKIGRTSIRVLVDVWCMRHGGNREMLLVTRAHVTMVSVDDKLRPLEIVRPTRQERSS